MAGEANRHARAGQEKPEEQQGSAPAAMIEVAAGAGHAERQARREVAYSGAVSGALLLDACAIASVKPGAPCGCAELWSAYSG